MRRNQAMEHRPIDSGLIFGWAIPFFRSMIRSAVKAVETDGTDWVSVGEEVPGRVFIFFLPRSIIHLASKTLDVTVHGSVVVRN